MIKPLKWDHNMICAAQNILRRHTTIAAAMPGDALKNAFKRHGVKSVGSHLAGNLSGAKSYVIISDVHVPYASENCMNAICDLMRDLQPDGFVINGDFLDLIEISRHSAGSVAQLEGKRVSHTFDAANRLLDRFAEAYGKNCKHLSFIEGNHEDRLRRWLSSGDNAVWIGDEATSIEARLNLKKRGFKYYSDYPKAKLFLGELAVTHGLWCSKNHAQTHLDRFKHAVLYGHTHSPQQVYGSTLKGLTGAFGAGHLADPTSPAMQYAPIPNAWCQGFSVVHVQPSGEFNVQLINFYNGICYFGGKCYGQPLNPRKKPV